MLRTNVKYLDNFQITVTSLFTALLFNLLIQPRYRTLISAQVSPPLQPPQKNHFDLISTIFTTKYDKIFLHKTLKQPFIQSVICLGAAALDPAIVHANFMWQQNSK